MTSTDQLLEKAAEDGSLDSEEWPRVLNDILSRLDEIVKQFPKPTISTSEPPPSATETPNKPQDVSIASQESGNADKENAPPATPPSRPPVPTFSRATSANADGTPQEYNSQMTSFYASIRITLTENFPKNPPHTIQRLAELILHPKARYRYLPPYLRALDRVVSVSSPTSIFPLPQATLPTSTSTLLNGTTTPIGSSSLGSDESLGGALLTPIPWLRSNQNNQSELISESTEMVDGPHGAGRIETVSVINGGLSPATTSPTGGSPTSTLSSNTLGSNANNATSSDAASLREAGGITQGELLRQEQEAGVVPASHHTSPTSQRYTQEIVNGEIVDSVEADEEHPHARGPEEIGMEDMGPQSSSSRLGVGPGSRGIDIEAAVGRPALSPQPQSKGEEEEGKEDKEEEMKDVEKDGSGEKEGEGKDEGGKVDEEMKNE